MGILPGQSRSVAGMHRTNGVQVISQMLCNNVMKTSAASLDLSSSVLRPPVDQVILIVVEGGGGMRVGYWPLEVALPSKRPQRWE